MSEEVRPDRSPDGVGDVPLERTGELGDTGDGLIGVVAEYLAPDPHLLLR